MTTQINDEARLELVNALKRYTNAVENITGGSVQDLATVAKAGNQLAKDLNGFLLAAVGLDGTVTNIEGNVKGPILSGVHKGTTIINT